MATSSVAFSQLTKGNLLTLRKSITQGGKDSRSGGVAGRDNVAVTAGNVTACRRNAIAPSDNAIAMPRNGVASHDNNVACGRNGVVWAGWFVAGG